MSRVEHIEFPGSPGTLRGMLHRPPADRAPAVVLLHGYTGTRVEQDRLFVQMARVLAGSGLAVLRFDFYGSGESDGDFEECTVQTELDDASAALDWLAAQPGIAPEQIGVIGLSMGGCVGALLAGQDARVKALVLLNAVSIPALHFQDMPQEGDDALIEGGQRIGPQFLPVFYASDPLAALRLYRHRALIVHGTADDVVPRQEADALQAALGNRGELFLLEGAGHTFQHPRWRETLFNRTAAWLHARLTPDG